MKNIKTLLLSFIASFVFFAGVNISVQKMEDFAFDNIYYPTGQMLSAQIYQEQFLAEKDFSVEKKEIEINAASAISLKINSKGESFILFEKESSKPLPIASLTKLMTGFIILDLKETYDPFQVLEISENAANQKGISVLSKGEYLTIKDLLYVVLLESSNDAAFALAELVSEKGFVQLMNIYAREIGLKNTFFINPTGLDFFQEQNHINSNVSTAFDLAYFASHILEKNPELFEITAEKEHNILKPNGEIRHISQNTNALLYEFPQIIGGKTGWTPIAGGCLIIVIEEPKDNSYIINVVLGAEDRFGEMRKLIEN